MVGSYIVPGISVDGFMTALVAAVVLSVINIFIKPVLMALTMPITVLTLGLFALALNALLIMLVGMLVPGFDVASFWSALLFSFVLSVISWLASLIK